MLTPFPVGSAADVIAAGAGGNIAAELTAKSPPDGYTIFMGTIGTQAINYSLYSKLNYHPLNRFTMIARVGDSPNVLVLNPGVPAKSVKELIALDTLAQQDVKTRLAASGVDTNPGTPEEFRKLIEAEIPKWAAVVKASGAKAD